MRPGGFPRRNRRPSRQGDQVGVGACRAARPPPAGEDMSTQGSPLVTVTPPDTTPRVEVPVPGDPIQLPVRLALLEATDAATATLDGAWWPRSRELATELPPLITVLRHQGIRVSRVAYHRENWEPAPRRLPADGRIVRLGWYPGLDPHLVRMTSGGGGRARLDLLVIPPDLDDAAAKQAMAAASQAGNHSVATAVLANVVPGSVAESLPSGWHITPHAGQQGRSPGRRNVGDANSQAGEDLRGHTSPACGTIPLPGGHCECTYANFDATNHPITHPPG
jgi:hypothetical protein